MNHHTKVQQAEHKDRSQETDSVCGMAVSPATAAALQKSSIKVGTVDREYYDSAPADYAARREYDARGIVVVVNFHDAEQTGQDGAASTCWATFSIWS